MKLLDHPTIKFTLFISFSLVLLFGLPAILHAQTKTPARTAYVNDFAGVVSETTKQQLETILANLKQKTGIEFDIAVVASTNGQEIADFSGQLAEEWGVGSRTSTKKSLLLVLAVGEKVGFTRYSRSVQRELPEGVLGEMSQQLRNHVTAGRFGEGLEAGVQLFVGAMANKLGLNAADFSGTPVTDTGANIAAIDTAKQPEPVATPSPIETLPVSVNSAATRERVRGKTEAPAVTDDSDGDADESEEVELTLTRPLADRIVKLKAFLDQHPNSKSRSRATELLVSARAALGDDKLMKGDNASGVEQLQLAIVDAPATASEKLFSGVVSQIPLNLYLRGEREAATRAAQAIEAKFGGDPKRLLTISGFYLGTEQGAEAVRVAAQAVKIAPEMAEAHQALGLGLHISLRLDEAAAEYKRALELDPNSKAARRSLADLNRAFGKTEEALALYRQELEAAPADKSARAGLVISLLELGRKDEAKVELDKALAADPNNLALLGGAAYWYAAHNDPVPALEYGTKAINVEPRYTWSYVAVARALVAQQKPLDAERALRFARQYGKFSTLDYELASTLASAGLYDEASEILMQSFGLKEDQIETRLGGRTSARSSNFIDLLAPERRASIFQFTAADNEKNARILKALLTFAAFTNSSGPVSEKAVSAAARDFASGDDDLRVYRQLYAATQLLRKGLGFQTALELAEAARNTADAGLNLPVATLAVQAEEYREIRARAIASGGTPNMPEAPRNLLSNLLRGRIEDISGWSLYNQDKLEGAADHLKRAVNILPEGTPAWRTAHWHLGAVLSGLDKNEEALASYIKSYNSGPPDAVRRSVIEQLYRKMTGSLAGLEERIGAGPGAQPINAPPAQPSPANDSTVPVPADTAPEKGAMDQPLVKAAPETNPAETPASPSVAPAPEASPAATQPDRTVRASGLRATVIVTGRVKDAQNNPMGNVVVVLISSQGTVLTSTTDEQGNYSFTVAPSTRSYRIIPSKDGFSFQPADKVLPEVGDDLKDLDFIGSAVPRP